MTAALLAAVGAAVVIGLARRGLMPRWVSLVVALGLTVVAIRIHAEGRLVWPHQGDLNEFPSHAAPTYGSEALPWLWTSVGGFLVAAAVYRPAPPDQ